MTKFRIVGGLFTAAIGLAVAMGPIVALTTATPAIAQEKAPPPPKPKTQKVQAMNKPTFEALTKAQAAIEAKNYAEAKTVLDTVSASDKLNEYERASVFQTYAYMYAEQENYKGAIDSFKKSIDVSNPAEGKGLPETQLLSTMYNLGQLYMVVEQYREAVQMLEAWRVKAGGAINGQGLAMLATAYYQIENFDKSLSLIKQAIASTPDPKENWYQLELAILLEKDNYKEAAPLLETILPKFPGNKTYWIQLSAIYNELGKEKESFVIYDAAHRQGFITEEKDIVRLARLYMYHENPYKGAVLMEKSFKANQIQRTPENLEAVANAFFNAREYKKAIPWLSEAAGKSTNGTLEMRLCQAQLQLNLYKDGEESCKTAIDKKGLKDEGAAWITLCIAQIEQKKWGAARASCNSAGKFKDKAKDADQWQKYIDSRNKEAQLAKAD
ncbi:MAG: tetratricopeptide repeat protein [Rhodospirillaceae bacterium]|nr:tetratricopeptide repeat protein [Rhodospirillaceae bacterium]